MQYNKGDDTGSYRLAVSPEVPDDGLTPEGKPKLLRYKKSPHMGRKKADLDDLKKEVTMEEHRIPLDILCSQLGTDPDVGLTPEQAHEILLRDGPNALTPPKRTPEWVLN
jgi:sodium/potassium-transporting ATPase subunit alpha